MRVSIFSNKEISKEKIFKFTFFITIIIIFIFTIIRLFLLTYNNFYVELSGLSIINKENNNSEQELSYYITDKKYDLVFSEYEVIDNIGNKDIHIKCTGKYNTMPSTQTCSVKIDNKINRVYLEDKNGNLREIWNKNEGSLIDAKIYDRL